MMAFKKVSKQGHTRIKFDQEQMEDPKIEGTFKATIGGKFALLTLLNADDSNMDGWVTKVECRSERNS